MWKTGGRESKGKRERERRHRKRERKRETEEKGRNCGLYYRCFGLRK